MDKMLSKVSAWHAKTEVVTIRYKNSVPQLHSVPKVAG